jgi:hypothetical protein
MPQQTQQMVLYKLLNPQIDEEINIENLQKYMFGYGESKSQAGYLAQPPIKTTCLTIPKQNNLFEKVNPKIALTSSANTSSHISSANTSSHISSANTLSSPIKTTCLTIPPKIANTSSLPTKKPAVIDEVAVIAELVRHYDNTLFWCIYVAVNGMPPFGKTTINEEIQIRQEIGNHFRTNAKSLKDKQHRITNADIEEILTDFMTLTTRKAEYSSAFGSIQTNLALCIAFSLYYKKNIWVLCEERKTFIRFSMGQFEETVFLFILPNKKHFVWKGEQKIAEVEMEYFQLENYKNPLKSISNYKLTELEEIGKRWNLPKMKKNELYSAIENICLFGVSGSSQMSVSV